MGKKQKSRWSRFYPKGDLLNEINYIEGKTARRAENQGWSNSPDYDTGIGSLIVEVLAKAYTGKDYESMYIKDKNVIDFICNTRVDSKSVDIFKNAFSYSGRESESVMFYIKGVSRAIFIVKLFPNGKEKEPMLCVSDGDSSFFVNLPNLSKMPDMYEDNYDEVSYQKILKPMINLFLYADAFPECVIDGPPPEDVPTISRSKKSHNIFASKAIMETYKNGIHPHMRRGHFRVLTSERYKNKRYQAVYVRPTMVKGHASHIVEPQ